jgi:hypothetical protein
MTRAVNRPVPNFVESTPMSDDVEKTPASGSGVGTGRSDPISTNTPSPARIYDWLLGGKDNFKIDRIAGEEVEARLPEVRVMVEANRAFLRRVVHYLAAECGIRQFLDIGSGLPSRGNVHEIAQDVIPDARVVYVDNDPVVLSHGQALLATNEYTAAVTADLRNPNSIIENKKVRELIDPTEPVGLLMIAVLHFIRDEENPGDLIDAFKPWMAGGSYLGVSHVDRTPTVASAAEVYEKATSPGVPRSRTEVLGFFDGFDLVEPGLVQVPAWRPASELVHKVEVPWWGGVGRYPGAEVAGV